MIDPRHLAAFCAMSLLLSASRSTNCGSIAVRKTMLFGLVTPTTNPARTARPPLGASAAACGASAAP
ncbi:hypothetical protein G3I40_33835, partial [Streptomyces sp. SID14478]|nr:hypothetical protein [Streptomyces sp. SID14478]